MEAQCTVVLDVGKTNAKLTLWNQEGACLARRSRPNGAVPGPGYRALDVQGVEAWAREGLRDFAAIGQIGAIAPVTHGAAAALVCDGRLFAPPLDYEEAIPADIRWAYDAERDLFNDTGSPRLPLGLNLGAQLFYLETLTGPWPDALTILPWPQYWAWRLCGVAACEVTSLGCHTDLWRPAQGCPSHLSMARGWSRRFGPLRRAGEVLGPISAEWVASAGLPETCVVLCGLHDSNAALVAARGHPQIAAHDATILSTGTWFIAMRSPAAAIEPAAMPLLEEARDCLINVDVDGRPVPSARFMGGREAELIAGLDTYRLTENYDPQSLFARVPDLVERGVMVLPGLAPGVGPFPHGSGRWVDEPADPLAKRAVLGLYLAMMADVVLDLVGSRDCLLIEGRFAEAEVFIRALARLRPDQQVYVSNAHDDVPYGALRLINPKLQPRTALTPVEPLDAPLEAYRARWRAASVLETA